MNTNQRGIVAGGAWLCASFALVLGCSASDSVSSDVGSNQDELRKPTPPAPAHGRPGQKPPARPGRGHGPDNGHWHGNGHGPCTDGHGGPGSGSGGAGDGTASGGSSSSAGSSSGGASSAGTGFGGFGGGTPGVCGDSTWGGSEQCDDGNTTSGDGCSSLCQLEPHYACESLGAPCELVVCGDSRQQGYVRADGSYAYEACDDGNAVAGDGCDASCGIEAGWICEQPGTACRQPACGDGRQDSWFVPGPDGGVGGSAGSGSAGSGSAGGPSGTYYYEECDDGNAASNDGCSSACTIETGWVCTEAGVACHQPACGDGIVDFIPGSGDGSGGTGSGGTGSGGTGSSGSSGQAGSAGSFSGGAYEACDDGNTVSGDGCDPSCSVEAGWSCWDWAAPCHRIVCGDGISDYPNEQCDDGNHIPNDGCTSCTWDNQGGFGGGSVGGFAGTGGGSAGSVGGSGGNVGGSGGSAN